MKKISLLITAVLFSALAFGQKFDFRKATWGMSKPQVMLTEKSKSIINNSDQIVYLSEVAGFETLVSYNFKNQKLTQGIYLFNQKNSNKNKYVSDFEKVKEILTEIYGVPERDENVWTNNLFKDDPDDIGIALSLNHVSYAATWSTEKTQIVLLLHGDNSEINLSCGYTSNVSSDDLQKDRMEKLKEGF